MQSRDTVPWKVRRHGDAERVLDPADLDALSANHDLDREDLESLAAQLTICLDESRRFRREDLDSPQQQRGLQDLDGALAELEAGSKRIDRALKGLSGLRFLHPFAHTGMPNPANAQLAALADALATLQSTQGWLERARKTGGVMAKAPADKRRLRDERRRLVCSALFDFWVNSGRSVTYTTNPVSNEREGPLIRFVNDVVRHLTDPPTPLAGDAVKSEIEAYRSEKTDSAPQGPLRRARHIDREAQALLQGIEAAATEPSARFLLLLTTITTRNQTGISKQRAADLRLAMLLAAALLDRSTTPSETATALTASAAAKSALARMVLDLDLLEDAAADLREALALVDAADPSGLRREILLSLAGTLAALDSMNDRVPSAATVDAYGMALESFEQGDFALRRAHIRTIIAVALARRGTRPDLAAAEAHLRHALADLQGHDAPKPLQDVAHNLALVLAKKAAVEAGDTNAAELEALRSEAAENLGALAVIEAEEVQLRSRFAHLGRVPLPVDRAKIILKLARTLVEKACASGSHRPLDEAADLAALATIMCNELGENDAASEATVLLLDIRSQWATAEKPTNGV